MAGGPRPCRRRCHGLREILLRICQCRQDGGCHCGLMMSARAALSLFCALALGACAQGGAQGIASAPVPSTQPVVIAALTTTSLHRATAPSASTIGTWEPPLRQLVPLRPDDVQLYLSVMRAAAGRARHPTKKDLDAIHATENWSTTVDAASRTQAHPPAPLDEAMIERSSNLTGQMADVQVASERGIDLARYEGIRDTIEAIAAPPRVEAGACARGDCSRAAGASPSVQDDPAATAVTIARDRRLLGPRLAEIRALQAIVRARR